jgi:hypothetical protein
MKTLYMTNSNLFIKSLTIIALTTIIFLTSCGKDEDTTLFKDCVLPWPEQEPIPQADLPKEIVDFTYKTFSEADTLYGGVIKFCESGLRLLIQPEGTANYDFLLYDSFGKFIAKGLAETDIDIRSKLRQKIKEQLGDSVSLYDTLSINYENGNLEYTAEVYTQGPSTVYLLDEDGNIICILA